MYDSGLADRLVGHTNSVSNVKKLLDDYGFSNVFTASNSEVLKTFPLFFEHRVIDCLLPTWHGNVDRSAVLGEYKLYKNIFSFEAYLLCVPKYIRMYLTRFRISSHSLRIQTGRYEKNKIARNERYCMYCGSRDIEDTYHFICIWPCYSTLRSRYIDKFYFLLPSVLKFNPLMGSSNKNILINLAKYIK